jgi:hypothetical protein
LQRNSRKLFAIGNMLEVAAVQGAVKQHSREEVFGLDLHLFPCAAIGYLDIGESDGRAFIILASDARPAAATDEGVRAAKVTCAFACLASHALCARHSAPW